MARFGSEKAQKLLILSFIITRNHKSILRKRLLQEGKGTFMGEGFKVSIYTQVLYNGCFGKREGLSKGDRALSHLGRSPVSN